MLKIDAEYLITMLVSEKLDRKTSPVFLGYGHVRRPAISLVVQSNLSSYSNKHSFEARTRIHFLFTGNTSVFMAVEGPDDHWYDASHIPLDRWKNTSNHDSCWRSDGVGSPISTTYFEMADEINKQRESAGLKAIAPVEMHQHNTLGISSLTKKWTVVTHPLHDEDNSGYWRELTHIEPNE